MTFLGLDTKIYICQFISVIPILLILWCIWRIVQSVQHSNMRWNWFENVLCCCLVTKLCLTLLDFSPPGSSVHGISLARILEWVAISFSRGSSWPWDRTQISCIDRWILYHWATREAWKCFVGFSKIFITYSSFYIIIKIYKTLDKTLLHFYMPS